MGVPVRMTRRWTLSAVSDWNVRVSKPPSGIFKLNGAATYRRSSVDALHPPKASR